MVAKQIAVYLSGVAAMLTFSQAQPAKIVGIWSIQITFGNGESRSLRFAATESGKGSFSLLTPETKSWESSGVPEGSWSRGDESSVIFSGPVQFPLGNVGIDRGTLLLQGKLGPDGGITGEAKFFPLGQDPDDPKATPSKSGRFTATPAVDERKLVPPGGHASA